MAAIRNSISMQDRMTPVFRSIIKSMDSTLRVMRNLDRQANNGVQSKAYRAAQRDIQRANNELIKMQNNLSRADRGANQLANSTKKVATNMSSMRSGGLNLTNLASGLYLLKNIGTALNGIMSTPDAMAAIQYRLETFDTTKATGSQLMDYAYRTAQDSRSDIESTASLASRILLSGATNGSGAESLNLAGILNKASFLGGSSAQESQRALLQLSQGLASGVLQGDELRSIREQAPGLTDTLAKGLSKLAEKGALPEKFMNTTMGDLKGLGSEGELTSARIIAAFKEMEDYVDTTFKKSPKQFGQAVTGIANVWKRWLGLMGKGDNALAKINNKAWELLEWFESDSGAEFFENLTRGVNFVVDAFFALIDGVVTVIKWFTELDNASSIVAAGLAMVAAYYIYVAGKAVWSALTQAAAWAVAHWKIALVIAAIGVLIYVLMECGITANQIIGGIAGGILFLGYLIWDIVIWLLAIIAYAGMAVWDIILAIVIFIIYAVTSIIMIVVHAIQAVVQILLWLLTTVDAIFIIIHNIIVSAIEGAILIVKGIILGLGEAVLGVMWLIAKGIDAIFGSDLSKSVEGWMKALPKKLDLMANVEATEDLWSDSLSYIGDRYTGKGEQDDWNILDNIGDTHKALAGGADWLTDQVDKAGFSGDAFGGVTDWALKHGTANPMDGWNSGYEWGDKLVGDVGEIGMKLSEMGDIDSLLEKGIGVDGGDLDSVGSIKSDVDISDEDIQLLRDVAARDYLLTLQTSTPQINNSFGDVRETADVNKILETIQDMVDEQLAVSLVVE